MQDRSQRIVKQHLRTDALLGVELVPRGEAPEAPAPQAPSPARSASSAPAAAPAPAAPAPPAPSPELGRSEKLRVLQAMDEQEVRGCEKCELCHGRTNTVFGEGAPDAPIMFIGEGPGQTEDEQGRPFVGRAGNLLTKMIEAMGFSREQVYIANVVKCRPPNNRTPTPAEVQTCWDYLRRQIETIRPRAIVTLGAPATKMLLGTKTGITRLRGTWHEYAGVNPPVPVMPTFHPAFLLRAYTKENRAKVWSDLQAVMSRVQQGD
ncbi:MAG: uracil-DNA glycosylase [Phycisphaeraceae bacterium]